MIQASKPAISVIIPCWGANKYLDELYNCIQSQTFKDAEWIMVNDGDASQNEKLEKIAASNNNIRVIWKENGGPSTARNLGIDLAKGDWIVFVDADDKIKPYYLEILHKAVKDNDVDMAIGGFEKYMTREDKYNPEYLPIENDISSALDLKSAISIIYNQLTARTVPWNKIYKTSIIKSNNLRFDPLVKMCEDGIFNNEYYNLVQKIVLIKNCGYIYILNDDSSLVSSYSPHYTEYTLRKQKGFFDLMRKAGIPEKIIEERKTTEEASACMLSALNVFRKKSPLNFRGAIASINENIFRNPQMVDSFFIWYKKGNKSIVTRLFAFTLRTRSAISVAIMVKMMFGIKYSFMKFYLKIKPFLFKTH